VKRAGLLLGIACAALAAGCLKIPLVKPEYEKLVPPVTAYLNATDPQEENRLLTDLMKFPVPELAAALKAPREFAPAPTGRLPDQELSLKGGLYRYGLYVPKDYSSRSAYPLLVCLHGAGFDGDTYLDRWAPRLGDRYILACPTVEFGAWWTREAEALVLAVIWEVTRNYRVDSNRVFLSGMSNGAIGTYLIGLNHVDRFAALNPMSGPLPGPLLMLLKNARTTPFYIIHGSRDQVIPARYSQEVWAYLLELGYRVEYHQHDRTHPLAGGHFFPAEELPGLVKWLDRQQRDPNPKKITMVRDRDHPGRSYWIRIDEVDPVVASFWDSETNPTETEKLKAGLYATVQAEVKSGNEIEITSKYVNRLTVLLNEDLVDFARPVIIKSNGAVRFEGMVTSDAGVLLEEARRRPDPDALVWAAVEIVIN
jgi:hypothetical protein